MKHLILKALLPSWKFFDQFKWAPELQYKVAYSDGEFSEWRPCLKKPIRTPASLFLNAEGNLYHACNTAIERLIQETQEKDPAQIEQSVSYGIVRNIVRSRIQSDQGFRQAFRFQFKVMATAQGEAPADILVSAIHEGL